MSGRHRNERYVESRRSRGVATGSFQFGGDQEVLSGSHVSVGAFVAFVGDEIATRHNDRRLLTDRGEMVRNRATWTVDAHDDGAVAATGRHGTVRLPAGYVSEHVELAYATTGMGAQGRTVQHAITFLDGPTDVRNLYVPMTRGRDSNEAFLATTGEQTAVDAFAQCLATDWIDQPALTRQAELANTKVHWPGMLGGNRLRDLFEQQHRIETTLATADSQVRHLPNQLKQAQHARTAAVADLDRWTETECQAQDVLDRYDRPLHRRRHEGDITIANRNLAGATNIIRSAHSQIDSADRRIEQLRASLAEAKSILATRAPLEEQLAEISDRLNHDLRVRTRSVSLDQRAAVVELIGARPSPGPKAREWDHAAAQLDQHQAAYELNDETPAAIDRLTYVNRRQHIADTVRPFAVRQPTRQMEAPDMDFGIGL